jgi:hypothetical protein
VIARGKSKVTGTSFNLVVAFEPQSPRAPCTTLPITTGIRGRAAQALSMNLPEAACGSRRRRCAIPDVMRSTSRYGSPARF